MKKSIGLLGLCCLFALGSAAHGDFLQVYKADGSNLSRIALQDVGAGISVMTKQTGDIAGNGSQQVVLHDGTNLRAYNYSGGSLSNTYSIASETPTGLATGGDMNADGRDDIAWFSPSASANMCRAYTIGAGASLSMLAGRTSATECSQLGFGNVAVHTGDEFNLYNPFANGYFVGLAEGSGSFSAAVYSQTGVWENGNLMDLQHVNMRSGYGYENFMCSFTSSGTQLAVWQGTSAAVLGNVAVNAGAANEALFLQVGDVNAANNVGPEEAVLYRKDGSLVAYTALSAGGFSGACLGNIGTGVTDLLIGDVIGDGLEELIVAKGDSIEVYSLSGGTPTLLSTESVEGLVDMSIGDLDGDGKGDIIVGATVPEPFTMTLLAMGGVAMLARKRRS